MKYPDGQLVKLGDLVKLGNDLGTVVCSIDDDQYTKENPKEQWGYLKRGVMIEFERFGLIHYVEPEPDLRLVKRAL